MARATRWTDAKVESDKNLLKAGETEKRHVVASGLYLFVRRRASGELAKQWQYRAQVDGVRRWLSLGSYPAIGLAKARSELLKHQEAHEAAKRGEADHPVTAARFARKAAKALPTVAEAFAAWMADKRLGSARKQGQPVRERTIAVLTESFDGDIKERLGDAKIAKLTREALQSCIDGPRRRGAPGAAAHVYRTLRGLMNFASARGYVNGADPMRGIENPKPYRPAPVNAANDAEIVALLAAVAASPRLRWSTKLAIEFSILTGARPTEVRTATWAEFNSTRSAWTIPADRVKSGRAFRIHLSQQALNVLERAKEAAKAKAEALGGGAPEAFVFRGPNGAAMEKMAIARALSRLAERTESDGGKKLTPHDLRRTFRTMLSRLGVPPHVAELCMNHQETETMRRVYDGHDYAAEMAEAWDRAGAHISALRAGGAQVVPIFLQRA